MTSQYFAKMHWLQVSHGPHLHSREGEDYTKVWVPGGGGAWKLPSSLSATVKKKQLGGSSNNPGRNYKTQAGISKESII